MGLLLLDSTERMYCEVDILSNTSQFIDVVVHLALDRLEMCRELGENGLNVVL
jgi:hypothetical protein